MPTYHSTENAGVEHGLLSVQIIRAPSELLRDIISNNIGDEMIGGLWAAFFIIARSFNDIK